MKYETVFPNRRRLSRLAATLLFAGAILLAGGCGGNKAAKKNNEFFTSGSREADQRASQRMAKNEQLTGSGESGGEKNSQKANPATGQPAQATGKLSLFERLGGQHGISAIVDDFTGRVLQDPRVNWERKGVTRGGFFHLHRQPSVTWNPTPDNIARLKLHLVQFISLATGGPPRYEGKEIKTTHAGMGISNPEFDAAVGDLKASLDKLQIANQEQKELLAIVESTRPEIVEQR